MHTNHLEAGQGEIARAAEQFDRRRFRPWQPPTWARQAACSGNSQLFFGPLRERASSRIQREAQARFICRSCGVQLPCRDHARRFDEAGVWGGESESDRVALRRSGAFTTPPTSAPSTSAPSTSVSVRAPSRR